MEPLMEMPKEKEYFIAVYLKDVTNLNKALRENEEQRMVAGLIYIDNYDEVIDSVEEVRQSLLIALVDRKINKYIAKVDGIVKKLENDKYFIAIKKSYFKELEEDKFSLLEDVKNVNIGNGIPATLSIGLGLSSESYAQSYNYARVAIDLALARGGDQAVIKDCRGVTYFGGKREQTSKNTRVKARVKAEALREFITVKDKIFVMGHPEYDRITLDQEYKRDKSKNLPIELPVNYYPNDDCEQKPLLTWRAHGNTLYGNWLNYYVYQATPYDMIGTPQF